MALSVGARALQARSTMSFIVENDITIVGVFPQNAFQTVRIGTPVDIVFDNAPGRIYRSKITAIPKGVGQGQIAVSGTLSRTNALGGASASPAEISVPDDLSRDSLRLGMSGSATAFSASAGRDRPALLNSRLDQLIHGPPIAVLNREIAALLA
jgi:multidrug resistance efflux pump